MPLRENEIARLGPEGMRIRHEPIRLRWEFDDLVAADAHGLRCAFSCSVRAIADPVERQMLREVLLTGRTAASAQDVVAHFHPPLRAAAARVAQAHAGSAWIEGDAPKRELIDALKSTAQAVAFACGLEVLPPFDATVQSPSFERQRLIAMQQQLAEKQAAGQIERLQRSAELFKQFHAIRGSAPELSPGQIIGQVSEADRGALMQALLKASAGSAGEPPLWAVAGPYLARVRMHGLAEGRAPAAAELFPLPPTLGPLRSVRAARIDGQDTLLVGAQHGFFLASPENPAEAKAFADRGFESSLGFNAVAYHASARQLCATHSEAGLVCWDPDAPEEPVKTLRPPALGVYPPMVPVPMPEATSLDSINMSFRSGGGTAGPRNLCALDDEMLLLSTGGKLLAWDGAAARTLPLEAQSEIISIFPIDRQALIVREDGTVDVLDREKLEVVSTQRRAGRLRSAAILPWLGSARLLLAGDEGPLQCVGFDDPLITQYMSVYRGLRAVAASSACIAAVSPDRQRLILWLSWEGRQPAAEIYLGAQARHRIADIAFALE